VTTGSGVETGDQTVRGRIYDVEDPDTAEQLLRIDLPNRIEGLAKVGRMVYATADVDGVWQVDWDAARGRGRLVAFR
jgi:hypothetical protein